MKQQGKQARGQHKRGKQMPSAEAAGRRGQICSPPRQKRKGKAQSGGNTLRSVGKGTPEQRRREHPRKELAQKSLQGAVQQGELLHVIWSTGTTGGGGLGQPDGLLQRKTEQPMQQHGLKEAWNLPDMPAQSKASVGGCRYAESRASTSMGAALFHNHCQSSPQTYRALNLP